MPVETSWYVENRVFYQRIYGKIAIEDFMQARDEILAKLDEGRAPIHCMISLLGAESFPSLFEMQKVAFKQEHPATGWTLLIIDNHLIRFIAALVTQLSTQHFKTVSTLEEAIAFIEQHDSTVVQT
ncbi:MAG: hypothetical protein U0694_06070 [Anaerolineae bacterium]